jgi:hypothetical protein
MDDLGADYSKWLKADLWTIERAILLLVNAESLPSNSHYSFGGCKTTNEQIIYDDFMWFWDIAKPSLIAGTLKKINKSYPSLDSLVFPIDFIQWAKLKGFLLPDELKTIDTGTQAEAVEDVGIVSHAGTEPKLLNQFDNDFKFSGLLNMPRSKDDWFEVIDAMTKDYYLQFNNSMPTEAQAWVRLCENPPTGYGITANKDKLSITMIGIVKPLNKRSFDRRWAKYTAKSSQI